MQTQVIIMAGGIGTRLMPISTPECPKQFLDILGCGKTLIQLTYERFLANCRPEDFWVVTSLKYKYLVQEQLPQIPVNQILIEPTPRGTAPCIAYASWFISSIKGESNLIFTPADALVLDKNLFSQVIDRALTHIIKNKKLCIIGIKPNRPAEQYGYIKIAEKLDSHVAKVASFCEKPNLETAQKYLDEGGYYWNAGIFIWNSEVIKEQFYLHHPQISEIMEDKEHMLERFADCEHISIDYAIIEKANNIVMVKGDFDWTDLGTWDSLQAKIPCDGAGNSQQGAKATFINCKNNFSYLNGLEKAIIVGLENYLILSNKGKLLILPKELQSRIKDFQ